NGALARHAEHARLQPVSKHWAGSRGLGREREGIDGSSKRPSRLRKSEIRVSHQPVSRFSHFKIRFPCATAITLLIYLPFSSDAVLLSLISPRFSPRTSSSSNRIALSFAAGLRCMY